MPTDEQLRYYLKRVVGDLDDAQAGVRSGAHQMTPSSASSSTSSSVIPRTVVHT